MNLKEVSELSWRQLYPQPNDETAISLEEFIATAKSEYAYEMWLKARNDKREEGSYDVPSNILVEKELDVKDGVMDISDLQILRSIPEEKWLQNIGGLNCECKYIKSDVNKTALLCDDDSLPDTARTYYVVGNKIKFPQGTHSNKLPIIYASSGEDIDDNISIDDAIAGIIRTRLIEIYAGKTGREDVTDNTNSSE